MLDRRLRSADPIELSLQKAELALTEGDIALMKRHLQPVTRGTEATSQQREIASGILAEGQTVTDAVSTLADDFIAQAHTDYVEGRFSRAKSTLAVLTRAGVELTDEADAIRTGIFNLELDRGRPFTLVEAAGLFEPGVLTRIADNEQSEETSEAGLLLDLFANASFVEDDQPGVIRRDDDVPPLDAPIELTDDESQPEGDGGEDQPLPDDIIERTLRANAQQKLAQANQAMSESRFASAIELYNELLATSRAYFTAEQIQQMERNRTDAQFSMNQPGDGDLIDVTIDENEAARTELRREFENLLNQSQQRLRSADISGARERVSSARLVLNAGRTLLSESEYEDRLSKIDEQLTSIEQQAIELQRIEAQRREEEIRRRALDNETQAMTQRADKINEQLDRVRALMTEQKYEECLQVLDQTLFLDPNNPAALLMKDIIRDIVISQGYYRNRKEQKWQFSRIVNDNAEAALPVADIVTYPDDWPRISLNRGEPVSASETPENRRVLASLESQRQDINFDNSLGDVVNFLQAVSSENFDVDWASLELISIDEQTPVQLNLRNVPFDTVLDRIIDKISDPLSPAGWAVRDGIVQIASDEALRRNTALVIYDIRDLLIEVPDYEDAPNIDLQNVLQSNQGGGGGQSPFDGDQQDDNEERDRQDAIDAITDIISGGGGHDTTPPIGIYRSGPKIEKFMRACNVAFTLNGSRVPSLVERLINLNNGFEAEQVLPRIIEAAADPRDFIHEPDHHTAVLDHLNRALRFDGFEVQQQGWRMRLVEAGKNVPVLAELAGLSEVIDFDTVSRDLDRALASSQTDPEDAVTAACSTVESVCRSILIELGQPLPAKKDVQGLYNAVKEPLGLSPARSDIDPLIAHDVRQILSGLATVIGGVGASLAPTVAMPTAARRAMPVLTRGLLVCRSMPRARQRSSSSRPGNENTPPARFPKRAILKGNGRPYLLSSAGLGRSSLLRR